jgi:hypothetical protein
VGKYEKHIMKGIVPVNIALELLCIPDRTIPYRGRLSQHFFV